MAHGTTRRQILQYFSQKMMHFFKNEGWKSFIVMSGLFVLKKNVFIFVFLIYLKVIGIIMAQTTWEFD